MNNTLVFPDNLKVIKGKDILKIESGKIVKVLKHSGGIANIGEVLMRTSDKTRPFVNLTNGRLWHSILDSYEFVVLPYDIIEFDSSDKAIKDEDNYDEDDEDF